ncbi:MAG TPA: hypothetical protein VIY86_00600, partial [Pirellulaceae bacterium]
MNPSSDHPPAARDTHFGKLGSSLLVDRNCYDMAQAMPSVPGGECATAWAARRRPIWAGGCDFAMGFVSVDQPRTLTLSTAMPKVPGVAGRSTELARLGLRTAGDLLFFFP